MVKRFYGGYGELIVVKTWTKLFEENLAQVVKVEHNPNTQQVTAYVQVAIIDRRAIGFADNIQEVTYCVCRAENYPGLMSAETFRLNRANLKAQVANNLKLKYELLSTPHGGSLWQ